MVSNKKMQPNYETCLKTIKWSWNETHIIPSEHHKLIIARTCFFACTESKSIRKKRHYTETWGHLPYFSICYQFLARRQDGRVQGHVLIFCKNPKIVTSCWPTIDGEWWIPPKIYEAFDCVDHNKLWKIFKVIGIPDHLTCLLRNLYAS